jgi:hypothetical protein
MGGKSAAKPMIRKNPDDKRAAAMRKTRGAGKPMQTEIIHFVKLVL